MEISLNLEKHFARLLIFKDYQTVTTRTRHSIRPELRRQAAAYRRK